MQAFEHNIVFQEKQNCYIYITMTIIKAFRFTRQDATIEGKAQLARGNWHDSKKQTSPRCDRIR